MDELNDMGIAGWFFLLDEQRHVEIYKTDSGRIVVVVVGKTPQFPTVRPIPHVARLVEARKSVTERVKEAREKEKADAAV